ncbi:MAG: Sapep family Mn(2+)-dependent dipeptidase [Oscillospiraceae bacterium]|nr:Sapep family Mn(2+)-dependent dipeptidase [Oscillospiraceae bacterium]
MSNRVQQQRKIDAWFNKHSGEMLDDLAKLIAINSVRGKAEDSAPYGTESRKALALAQAMLNERGFGVNLFEDKMITAEFGPNPPLMGILAHLDVVAPGEGWDSNPFEMTIKNGNIYGRGVMDNKGPSVAAMYALYCVCDICPALKHGVQLIFGSGEETGFDDITEYLKKNTPPPNVFTPDAEYPIVNIEKGRFMPVFGAKWDKETALPRVISVTGGNTPNTVPNYSEAVIEGFPLEKLNKLCRDFSRKTGLTFKVEALESSETRQENRLPVLKLTAEGTSAHASLPERGNNAQTALIELLAAIPFADSESFRCIKRLSKLFPHGDYCGTALGIDMHDEKTGRITVNFGVMRLTEYEFSGNFDSRTPACADEIDLLEVTKTTLENNGFNITYHEITGCHHTPEETEFVQKLLNIYKEYTGQQGKCLAIGGLTYVHDIPGGVAFGCVEHGEDNKVHGANEFISINQLINSAKMFTQAIIDMCAG